MEHLSDCSRNTELELVEKRRVIFLIRTKYTPQKRRFFFIEDLFQKISTRSHLKFLRIFNLSKSIWEFNCNESHTTDVSTLKTIADVVLNEVFKSNVFPKSEWITDCLS